MGPVRGQSINVTVSIGVWVPVDLGQRRSWARMAMLVPRHDELGHEAATVMGTHVVAGRWSIGRPIRVAEARTVPFIDQSHRSRHDYIER